MGRFQPERLYFVLAATIPLSLCAWTMARRGTSSARAFSVVLLSEGLWIVGQALELWAEGLEAKLWLDGVQYVCALSATLANVLFTLRYTRTSAPSWLFPILATLLVPPLVVLITAPLHGIGRADAHIIPGHPFDALHYSFHPLDAVVNVVVLVCTFASIALAGRHVSRVHEAYLPGTLLVFLWHFPDSRRPLPRARP